MALAKVSIIEGQDYASPILVTVIYWLVFQVFMAVQIKGRTDAGGGDPLKTNRFDYSNKQWEMSDRSFLNFLEQTPFFLSMLWLFAFFCNAETAGTAGFVYVIARALYPVFWSVKGEWNLLIELSTQPGYCVLTYFLYSLAYLVITGKQLGDLMPSNTAAVGAAVVFQIVNSILVIPLGFGAGTLLAKGFSSATLEKPLLK
eukprot:TRINITY_DN112364_c0_g1_i1.p1 TRINITY_DN112364_c0_g1~~TRINITY_DN112364_c0_g1_i1.p1  ORF type:complete len:201 (-),score=37.23 TRINITY_DN112364_c0_g1_i1:277-879(-)